MDGSNGKKEKKTSDDPSTMIKKLYNNKFDAVKQSLRLARKNRKTFEEQSSAAISVGGVGAGTVIGTERDAPSIKDQNRFDLHGFGAIIAIAFFSTGLVFAMKKYILMPGEFWRTHGGYNSSRQQYHSNAHQHRYTHGHHGRSRNGGGTGSVFDKDHATKHNLTILKLPTSNLRPSLKEVKDAYRKICLTTHPDVVCATGGKSKKYLEERFILATKAHDELIELLK